MVKLELELSLQTMFVCLFVRFEYCVWQQQKKCDLINFKWSKLITKLNSKDLLLLAKSWVNRQQLCVCVCVYYRRSICKQRFEWGIFINTSKGFIPKEKEGKKFCKFLEIPLRLTPFFLSISKAFHIWFWTSP